jgi:hypothetical protein
VLHELRWLVNMGTAYCCHSRKAFMCSCRPQPGERHLASRASECLQKLRGGGAAQAPPAPPRPFDPEQDCSAKRVAAAADKRAAAGWGMLRPMH